MIGEYGPSGINPKLVEIFLVEIFRMAPVVLQWQATGGCNGSVASCGNHLTEGVIGKQTQSQARLPSAEPGRSKSYQPPVVMTRYPNERTWLATAYVSPIADWSRTAKT